MLVLDMNTKRRRRPNVRLGEIGADSAAFSRGFSQVSRENFGQKRLKNGLVKTTETENKLAWGFSEKSFELTNSDPGVSPRNSTDSQHNRENNNPNSSRPVGFTSRVESAKGFSTLDFGNITRKCRAMKRRGQSSRGNNWGSKLSPEFSGQEHGDEHYNADIETLATSKESSDNDSQRQHQFDCNWNDDANDSSDVRTWLEDLGFGKYADVFDIHEVDEEALPLLTLDDLKEMGVCAVGPRRKLYNAIQRLRCEDV